MIAKLRAWTELLSLCVEAIVITLLVWAVAVAALLVGLAVVIWAIRTMAGILL